MLRQGAVRHPDRVGIVSLGPGRGARSEHTYASLDAGARRWAGRLVAAGVRPGEAVGLVGPNRAAFVEAWFGVVYAGATIVPVPAAYTAPEIAERLSRAHGVGVIADPSCAEAVAEAARAARCTVWPLEHADDASPVDELVPPPPGSPAMVLFTSGTTCGSRGAAQSHAAMLLHTTAMVHHTLRLSAADRVLGVLPLTHSYGARMVMLASLFAGARAVLVPRFSASGSLTVLRDEGITWLPAVPTMFAAWASIPGPPHDGPLRWCLSAGAPIPDDVVLRAEARLGAEVRQGYGMTEATFSTLDAPPAPRTLGSVGRPAWGVEVRVTDDAGRPLPAGVEGHVRVRGHHLFDGYLDDPEATAAALAGGWMHTGDVGRLDAVGRLTVVDRTKDVILRGGENVYPSEVEAALQAHPDVHQVAVVGRPDAFYGEVPIAFVIPEPAATSGPKGWTAWAAARLAKAKVPVAFRVVDALPTGPSGKVLKRVLRQQVAHLEVDTAARSE